MTSGWRSLGLESLLGARLDESGLTEAVLAQLVSAGIEEGEQLDFKSSTYRTPRGSNQPWTEEQEFSKDAAAFANHRGGVILIGVADTAGVATSLTPLTTGTAEAEEQRLRRALVNNAAPLMPTSFVPITSSSGGFYLAVVVPPSHHGPHCVADRGDSKSPLRYPVRDGKDTRWLNEADVAGRYQRRFVAATEGRTRIQSVVDSACRTLDRSTGAWLHVATIPEFQHDQSIDAAFVEEASDWHRSTSLTGPIGGYFPAFGRGIAGPGKVTFTASQSTSGDDETRPREVYVELYGDGSAVAAAALAARSGQEVGSHGIAELRLVEDAILAVDRTVTWTERQVGAWGTASVVMGIYTRHGHIDPNEPFELIDPGTSPARRSGTRPVFELPRAEVVADLGFVETMQQRLAVSYQALSGLLQWFGLPEPTQITADGDVVPQEWLLANSRQVEDWAASHDVNIQGLQTS